MKILSIDVGIKNLAFCLFEKSENSDYFKITKWDTVNISEQHEIQNCIFIDKIGLCNKPAKFSKDDQCFCLKHSKKQKYLVPNTELKKINKHLNDIVLLSALLQPGQVIDLPEKIKSDLQAFAKFVVEINRSEQVQAMRRIASSFAFDLPMGEISPRS